jgi:hypothetical protein
MADDTLLRRAAERAGHLPFYLASSFLAYARAERLDDAELAARVGCDLANLPLVLLCRRPTGEGAVFRADVEAIAERFALDAARLARLIRSADAVMTLADAGSDQAPHLLAAARDRDPADADGGAPDEPPARHRPGPAEDVP